MSEELIKKAKRILEGVTPEPWRLNSDDQTLIEANFPLFVARLFCGQKSGTVSYPSKRMAAANAGLIVASPQLVRDLCNALESSMKREERMRKALERISAWDFNHIHECGVDGLDECGAIKIAKESLNQKESQ